LNDYILDLIKDLKEHDLDPSEPNISEKIVNHYKDIVGETHNIKLLFIAAISRKLPKPIRISIYVNSSSGSGKSWTVRKVLKPFSDDLQEFTRFTDAWFSRMAEQMDGKILFLQEISQKNEAGKGVIGQMKILLSDEGISYGVMEHSPEGWVPTNYRTKAMPVVISTSTNQLNGEDARRFFTISTDESEEQTLRIIKHNLKKDQSPIFQQEIEQSIQYLKILAEFYEKISENITNIIIPFALKMENILPKHLRMRTNVTRLLQLIKLFAFLHIMNRECIIVKKDDITQYSLLAKPEDLKHAISIASRIFDKEDIISDGSLKLLHVIKKKMNEKFIESEHIIDTSPTIKECKEETGLGRGTFYNYLNPLIEHGFVENKKIKNSRENKLKLTGEGINKILHDHKELNIEFSDEELSEWKNIEFTNGELIRFRDVLTGDISK